MKRRRAWRESTGKRCLHGLLLVLVDGAYVRNRFDSDFAQGGNGYRYSFIPKGEIWIDADLPQDEWPFTALHECEEAEVMRRGKCHGAGACYEHAHDRAKAIEDKLRRKLRPGEGQTRKRRAA